MLREIACGPHLHWHALARMSYSECQRGPTVSYHFQRWEIGCGPHLHRHALALESLGQQNHGVLPNAPLVLETCSNSNRIQLVLFDMQNRTPDPALRPHRFPSLLGIDVQNPNSQRAQRIADKPTPSSSQPHRIGTTPVLPRSLSRKACVARTGWPRHYPDPVFQGARRVTILCMDAK
jgi:hypothetical protein